MLRKSKVASNAFEGKKKNPISLRDDESLDNHLKVIKIGGENAPLSLSKEEFRVTSDLFLEGKLSNPLLEVDFDYLEIRPKVYHRFSSSDYAGSLDLYVASGKTYFLTSDDDFNFLGTNAGVVNIGYMNATPSALELFHFDLVNTKFRMQDDTDTGDNFIIQLSEHGATSLTTLDDDATAGHITLVPDGDLVLDPVSQKTIINATDQLYFDGGGDTYIAETSADVLSFVVGGQTFLTMTESSTDIATVGVGFHVPALKRIGFDGGLTGTYITESADDVMDIAVGGDIMVQLDEANDRITLEASKLAYKLGSGGDEFSVADSAYAGMILGYRMIGEDAIHLTYTLTTSMVVPASAMAVRFIAPPSGAVEVMVNIMFDGASNRTLTVGLSDNATYNSLGNSYEQISANVDETDNYAHQHFWTITGLTAGDTYNYWFGASANGGTLAWGGTGAGRYPDFIMKVTALPTAVADFAEYD